MPPNYTRTVKGPSYTYTPAGRLLTRTWARGITTTYGHNAAGEVSAITYSDGGATPAASYGYDRRGRLTSAGLTGGDARTFSYLEDGQPATETVTAGPLAGWSLARSPDALGRRASLQVAQGNTTLLTQSFGFDGASRLKTAAQGTASATYDYWADSAANLAHTITFTRGSTPVMTTAKDYDSLDRLTGINSTVGASPASGFGYGYNAAGQRESASLADGTLWRYGYDGLGQLTQASRQWVGDGSPVAGQQYGYRFDGSGNRTQATLNGRQSAYSPNKLNQYTERTVPGAVDVVGVADTAATVTVNGQVAQRQEGGYFYKGVTADNSQAAQEVAVDVVAAKPGAGANGANALGEEQGSVFLPKTPEVFTYDDDGNTTSDGRWVYSWDGENRLVELEARTDLPAQAKKRLAFGYDALGRRTLKQTWNWNANTSSYQPAGTTGFLYDGWNLLAEVDGTTNNLLRSYLWGTDLSGTAQGASGVAGLMAVNDHTPSAEAEAHFAAYDGNGNVVALVKASDASTSALYEYGPFGETIRITGPMSRANPVRWSSKYTDEEWASVYYGGRYYQASSGRWLSRDPLGERGLANLYEFAWNNSLSWVDTDGYRIAPVIPRPPLAPRLGSGSGQPTGGYAPASPPGGPLYPSSATFSPRVNAYLGNEAINYALYGSKGQRCCCECVTDLRIVDRGLSWPTPALAEWKFSVNVYRHLKAVKGSPGTVAGEASLSWTETSNRLPEDLRGYNNDQPSGSVRVTDYPTLMMNSSVFSEWLSRPLKDCPRDDIVSLTDNPAALTTEGPRDYAIRITIKNPDTCNCQYKAITVLLIHRFSIQNGQWINESKINEVIKY